MSSMRETIARAIYMKRNGAGARPWGHLQQSHKDPYLSDADAALEAIEGEGWSLAKSEPLNRIREFVQAARDGK